MADYLGEYVRDESRADGSTPLANDRWQPMVHRPRLSRPVESNVEVCWQRGVSKKQHGVGNVEYKPRLGGGQKIVLGNCKQNGHKPHDPPAHDRTC